MTKNERGEVRVQLEEERGRLRALIDGLRGDTGEGTWTGTLGEPGDMADAASARSARSEGESALRSAEHRLQQVDDALVRLDDGTYGTCEVCEGPIGAARLEALPFTTVCLDDVRAVARTA